ncbi:hypothetical protein SKAU_G00104210 [Synaphobranchus kaupii]|uniref:Uncharacterized protein n=1 Tax=Synaphobranchus kaupii TaxID=118154 RepID=A0A9Q1FZY5_SYNKA|nr:hypothetical protein SKAU_G00104210 [Synaphobranchus kaupii]
MTPSQNARKPKAPRPVEVTDDRAGGALSVFSLGCLSEEDGWKSPINQPWNSLSKANRCGQILLSVCVEISSPQEQEQASAARVPHQRRLRRPVNARGTTA